MFACRIIIAFYCCSCDAE